MPRELTEAEKDRLWRQRIVRARLSVHMKNEEGKIEEFVYFDDEIRDPGDLITISQQRPLKEVILEGGRISYEPVGTDVVSAVIVKTNHKENA